MFTIDGGKILESYGQIGSLLEGSRKRVSSITIPNFSISKQGQLCCSQPSSSKDCVRLRVRESASSKLDVKLENVTFSQGCRTSVSRCNSTLEVLCTLEAASQQELASGFMTLYKNGKSEPVFDLEPQIGQRSRSNSTVWWKTDKFAATVQIGDTIGCHWDHHDLGRSLKLTLNVTLSLLNGDSTQPPSPTASTDSSSLSKGAIAAIAASLLVVLLVFLVVLFCWLAHKYEWCRDKLPSTPLRSLNEATGNDNQPDTPESTEQERSCDNAQALLERIAASVETTKVDVAAIKAQGQTHDVELRSVKAHVDKRIIEAVDSINDMEPKPQDRCKSIVARSTDDDESSSLLERESSSFPKQRVGWQPPNEVNEEIDKELMPQNLKAGNQKSQSTSSREMQTTQQFQPNIFNKILRPEYWTVLNERLCPKEVIDKLYEKRVITYDLVEEIRTTQTIGWQVDILLARVSRMNDEDVKKFAVVLSKTNGISDVGGQLLRDIETAGEQEPSTD
ncbi:uncharacterized protein LOC134186652 isoform X2 [Corticium candelabrum]|nr:uncharacterized protein LOC134186652 isoform X2 [Corticium candelabrum]